MKSSRNQYHFAVRRAQNNLNKIQNDKLVRNIGKVDMFEEIKKSCKDQSSEVTSVVDDIEVP